MLFSFDLQLFAGEKTEEPTAKKRADAKKKGQVGKSQEINAAFVMMAGFVILYNLGGNALQEIMTYSSSIFGHLVMETDEESVMQLFISIIIVLAKTSLPMMVFIMIIGLAINFFQVGLNFNTEAIGFKPDKLNPINGFGRIFSKRSLVELVKSIIKIVVIGFFIYDYMVAEILQMPKLIFLELGEATDKISSVIFMLAFKILGVFFVMAAADLYYQKWQTTQDLKMSKQDIKDEFKQTEGDPQIKGKIKSKQRQMAMARMMQEVPQADVIVTNPTHFAVAMSYKPGMAAPIVVAKGQDHVAQRIKEIAREHKVPIVENKPLARALFAAVEIGDSIPQELYKAVAEVLAYVYKLKNKGKRRSA
ncbi:MAG: flagellar biosynthesis protein FlhB [Selenomonadales bacterium]|nr:flagellar biosynthesis protein FlhB [Selenomonadales bacterium]MDY3739299.1 flagellar biosynthesis protein FlhB [Selenomonadaceae bacterium]MEE1361740.1 flagellar biosynthesis protein FlhB [Selenomonadaceae bacterium]